MLASCPWNIAICPSNSHADLTTVEMVQWCTVQHEQIPCMSSMPLTNSHSHAPASCLHASSAGGYLASACGRPRTQSAPATTHTHSLLRYYSTTMPVYHRLATSLNGSKQATAVTCPAHQPPHEVVVDMSLWTRGCYGKHMGLRRRALSLHLLIHA